jgi:chromosomal replication initiation ATPase DnaA
MTQIALPLDIRSGAESPRIVIGAGNSAAIAALSDAANWPFHTALLIGEPRSGKSLLARWFASRGHGDALDDAHLLPEADVFHAWNRAQEMRRPLLLTAGLGWQVSLPDLASRIGGSLQITLAAPDEGLMADLIAAHAEQRRLAVGEGAAAYLVPRLERSYAAIEAVVAAIDRISLERQAPVTMSVWRDALEAVQGPEQGRLL